YRPARRRRHERGVDPPPGPADPAAARRPGALDRQPEQPEHLVAVPQLSGDFENDSAPQGAPSPPLLQAVTNARVALSSLSLVSRSIKPAGVAQIARRAEDPCVAVERDLMAREFASKP